MSVCTSNELLAILSSAKIHAIETVHTCCGTRQVAVGFDILSVVGPIVFFEILKRSKKLTEA